MAMVDESASPDLAEIMRQLADAAGRGDPDDWADSFARDAVFLTGVGRFHGRDAIRGYVEDFWRSYDEQSFAPDEVHDLGNGVAWFSAVVTCRLRGASADVHLRFAVAVTHAGGVVSRWTDYVTTDEARAAAERLAKEGLMADESTADDLGALLHQSIDAYNRRDFATMSRFLSEDVVYRPISSFTDSRERRGRDDLVRFYEEFLEAWADDFVMTLDTVRVYGDTVIARCVFTGHARASDAEIAARMFVVYFFQNGLITRCEDFGDREEALKAAGVAE